MSNSPVPSPGPDPSPGPVPGPSLQQHDLRPRVASAVVGRIRIIPGATVVEIGSGRGNLTAALLAAGAIVHAIELDPDRCRLLSERFADAMLGGQFIIDQGDALRRHPQPDGPWQVVANPPFQHTAALVRGWLLGQLGPCSPLSLDLILQREAASKLGGGRQAETRSSILTRLAGEPRLVQALDRSDTIPASRVDLVQWSFRRTNHVAVADLVLVDRLLDRAFAGTHTMQDALRGLATAVQIRRQAQEQGWDPQAHPRTLPSEAWLPLARLIQMCGKLP